MPIMSIICYLGPRFSEFNMPNGTQMQARNQEEQGGKAPLRTFFATRGKMCWIQFKNIGHSSTHLGPSR